MRWTTITSRFLAALLVAGPHAYALVPGGLVASHANALAPADTMSVTITVERDPGAASSYFWAQQFFPAATVDHGGYFGMQTGGTIGGALVGRMFIFSIWNATAADAAPGAVAQPFGGEGVGYSIRMPYAWRENVPYTFSLSRLGAWWQLSVAPPGASPIMLGRIQITQDVPLGTGFASFTEYFRPVASCESLPYARAAFSGLTAGGTAVAPRDASAYGTCAAAARGLTLGAFAVHEAGAAPPFAAQYSAQVSGSLWEQTITATVRAASADRDLVGHVFVAAVLPGGEIYLRTPAGWWPAAAGVASYSAGTVNAPAIPVVAAQDLRALVGTRLFVGYGAGAGAATAFDDMLVRGSFAPVHTVR